MCLVGIEIDAISGAENERPASCSYRHLAGQNDANLAVLVRMRRIDRARIVGPFRDIQTFCAQRVDQPLPIGCSVAENEASHAVG